MISDTLIEITQELSRSAIRFKKSVTYVSRMDLFFKKCLVIFFNGAADQIRTDDLLHGKQTLYQLSYNRIKREK